MRQLDYMTVTVQKSPVGFAGDNSRVISVHGQPVAHNTPNDVPFLDFLENAGATGWQLVSGVDYGSQVYYIFCRIIAPPPLPANKGRQ